MSRIVPSQVVSYIDQEIPKDTWAHLGPGQLGALAGLLKMVDRIPDELLSMDTATYSAFVLGMSTIKEQLEIWRRPMPGIPPELLKHGIAIRVVRESLSKCPDEAPAPSTSELKFVTDADLRQSLRNDIGAIYRAHANGEWKAATVLAGSVIEALLLREIQNKTRPQIDAAIVTLTTAKILTRTPKPSLECWDLYEFIEVAENLRIIKKETAIQARLAKDFRNLIHPGRAQRTAQKCDRGTALSAMAGVEFVIRDLTEIRTETAGRLSP